MYTNKKLKIKHKKVKPIDNYDNDIDKTEFEQKFIDFFKNNKQTIQSTISEDLPTIQCKNLRYYNSRYDDNKNEISVQFYCNKKNNDQITVIYDANNNVYTAEYRINNNISNLPSLAEFINEAMIIYSFNYNTNKTNNSHNNSIQSKNQSQNNNIKGLSNTTNSQNNQSKKNNQSLELKWADSNSNRNQKTCFDTINPIENFNKITLNVVENNIAPEVLKCLNDKEYLNSTLINYQVLKDEKILLIFLDPYVIATVDFKNRQILYEFRDPTHKILKR